MFNLCLPEQFQKHFKYFLKGADTSIWLLLDFYNYTEVAIINNMPTHFSNSLLSIYSR